MKPILKLLHVREVESNKKRVPAIVVSGLWIKKLGWHTGEIIRIVSTADEITIKKEKV